MELVFALQEEGFFTGFHIFMYLRFGYGYGGLC